MNYKNKPPLPEIKVGWIDELEDHHGYAITTEGDVYSCLRSGKPKLPYRDWTKLNPAKNYDGYLQIEIKGKTYHVHLLIMKTYVGSCPAGKQTRHLNGDPTDSSFWNLKYGTPRQNQKDRIRHKTDSRGAKHPSAKLTNAVVLYLRKEWNRLKTKRGFFAKMGRQFSLSWMTIKLAVEGKTWKNIGDK